MERGFLENIMDMFKGDPSLFRYISSMMSDERSRVRIGTAALVEGMKDGHITYLHGTVEGLGGLLHDKNPSIRGDAAYVLGIIGGQRAYELLSDALQREEGHVKEAIEEIVSGMG